MYNPYYSANNIDIAKMKVLMPLIHFFGEERLYKIYNLFKMRVKI